MFLPMFEAKFTRVNWSLLNEPGKFPFFLKTIQRWQKNSRKTYMLTTAVGQERGVLEKSIEHETSDAPVLTSRAKG